jgi:hypothetical protein
MCRSRVRAAVFAQLPSLAEQATDRHSIPSALELNEFLSKRERCELAAALNTLLALPTFASWCQGASLDVAPTQDRTPVTIVNVAHLDDAERSLVLGVLLEEVLSWVRSLPGSQRLRGLVVFDEVFGFPPPYPANPPCGRYAEPDELGLSGAWVRILAAKRGL